MVTGVTLFLCILSVVLSQVSKINADWQGKVKKTLVFSYRPEDYCTSYFLSWCTAYKKRFRFEQRYSQQCLPGWTHSGDQHCNIPICSPKCQHGGKCVGPDECECTTGHVGRYTACTTVACSHMLPCYPGICVNHDSCSCDIGFNGTGQDACLTMTPDKGMPEIGLSTCTLSHVRRSNGTTKFAYITDGYSNETDTLWSNQKDFNYLKFEFQSVYKPPYLLNRPWYIHDSEFGIVNATVSVNISKIPRSGGPVRDVAFTKHYNCQGQNDTTPNKDIANCMIIDDQFSINIEHGDWLHVVFTAKSGGYRKVNTNQKQTMTETQIYKGQIDRKEVEFKFDFEAPEYCSESNNFKCSTSIDTPLKIEKEFTKLPLNISWAGWTDELSGMERYHLEVFKLSADPYGNLEELSPLTPVSYADFNHTHDNIYRHFYTPEKDGMYSVLLQAADKANNSKIVRRLVLYSPNSNISLNKKEDGKIFVSSAVLETDYMWQTAKVGDKINITVEWVNHFTNKFIQVGNLLNKVKPYPIQFQEIQMDGILRSLKFVSLDDDEGARTTSEIPNKHGIIRFEAVTSYSDDTNLPAHGWFDIPNVDEKFSFSVTLNDGKTTRIWVRAHDILGNTIVDGTEVHFDTSGPIVSKESVYLVRNQVNGTYNYTSRIKFQAGDHDSGLHKIGFTLTRDDTGEVKYYGYIPGSSKNINGSCKSHLECICVLEKCFLRDQILDLDNCWLMTAKEELDHVNITVNITVYNQALLSENFSLKIYNLTTLEGLEKYSGPTNMHVAQNLPNGVRLAWDFPETESCYGRTDIGIILYMLDGTTKLYTVSRNTNFVDIVGLNPGNNYEVAFSLQYGSQRMVNMPFSFKTSASEHLVPVGAIIGVVVASVTIIAILITVFTVLWRKGSLEHFQKHLSNLSLRYRESIRRTFRLRTRSESQSYFSDDVYVYGGIKYDDQQDWYINRDDVALEKLLKVGHFANIYQATAYKNSNHEKTVAVKTLKEGFGDQDWQLVMAKINFAVVKVGDNPYILKFIGAVIDDDVRGPFIIYEFCEKGTLKDYLESQRDQLTLEMQEKLYRFGLDICKGMQYLASKDVVHRRLAARNVLLTARFAVKISGFGPQEVESSDDDAEAGKKERIPIKWMAPECMHSTVGATEKSDVWSYGVVLWEIFSLGETPYPSIRSRDLPSKLKKAERLPKPAQCDDSWYSIMSRTWNQIPQKRPTFEEIREELDRLFIESSGDYIYYYRC
ncbi:hypothetical protein CHS0354_004681 [Potamilus streckersoni]|uniref:Receptor protein-tyrosine kinase n=1 Tax=Potamilus streckersoni TaxID=2493646 RepID=A0AAE0VTE4_9BIVA|nr:hypothetical protein CHS0354_004681 [Potamilus streckersoni]